MTTPSVAWKQVVTVLMTVIGPPVSVVLAFFAAITWSDCFLSCSGNPNHLAGGLLWTAAALMLLSGPLLAAFLVRRVVWVVGACAVPVLEVLALVVRNG